MSTNTAKPKSHFRRLWFFYIVIIALLGFAAFLWVSKDVELKKQAKAFELEKSMIMEGGQQAFQSNVKTHLGSMMKTFVWAVRGELTRGNEEQVNQYFNQLVKYNNFEEITLVDNEGNILISTNKKYEGSKLAASYADAVLKIEDLVFIEESGKEIIAGPIMSLSNRLGTLIVIHKKDIFQLEKKVDLTKNE